MKKWRTTQQLANYIAKEDRLDDLEKMSNYKELNISQCNAVAARIKFHYREGGRNYVKAYSTSAIKSINSLTASQVNRAVEVTLNLMNHRSMWNPFSRVRCNMRRVSK
tara:strand:- start:675 stop:998 length:324 start_codon:yes stop_codon:yes gene_type:complete